MDAMADSGALGGPRERGTLQRSEARTIAGWLLTVCALVAAIVVVGGITRLTRSGLSIVEWHPISGAIPPLTDVDWNDAFAKYRETPEYKLVNHGMSLAEFKGIYWWEFVHRLLGRLIGLAFALPYAWFALRGRLDRLLNLKLLGVLVLGGLQGAMGWYMVKSGLVDDPRVSHLRLTAHLSLAVAIFSATLWIALDLLRPAGSVPNAGTPPRRLATLVVALVFGMIVTGGLVAGIRAGYAYNTFPLMNGHLVPPEIVMIDPWYLNFVNNMATVQFDHRLLAWALMFTVPWLWWRTRGLAPNDPARSRSGWLLAALAAQVSLGIATLLAMVPVGLAATHQGGAIVVLAAALATRHAMSHRSA